MRCPYNCSPNSSTINCAAICLLVKFEPLTTLPHSRNKELVLRHIWQFLDIIISWLEHNSALILDFFLLNQNLEQCSNQAYSMQKCRCLKWITILKEYLQYIFIVYTCHQRISIWLLILYHTLKRLASYRTNAYYQ